MPRFLIALLGLVLLTSVPLLGDVVPVVLQPTSHNYSSSELITLNQAMIRLEKDINTYALGSQKSFSADEWSSEDFAAYTAGVLQGMGYETLLVSQTGWPDGVHTWVLVGLSIGGKVAWLPVEASPEENQRQNILGYVPRDNTNMNTEIVLAAQYMSFDRVISLNENYQPIANFRTMTTTAAVGDQVRFIGVGSNDSNGEIIWYEWDFGDGDSERTLQWWVRHKYDTPGQYVVRLTVIDSRGMRATIAGRSLSIYEPAESPNDDGSCPCGS